MNGYWNNLWCCSTTSTAMTSRRHSLITHFQLSTVIHLSWIKYRGKIIMVNGIHAGSAGQPAFLTRPKENLMKEIKRNCHDVILAIATGRPNKRFELLRCFNRLHVNPEQQIGSWRSIFFHGGAFGRSKRRKHRNHAGLK